MTRYPDDEFDVAARERAHKGVHRPAEPRWKRFLPIILAAIAGPLLAWGVITALSSDKGTSDEGRGGTETSEQTATETTPGEGGENGETGGENGGENGGEAEPTPEAPPVAYDAKVDVLNGARISGLAGRTAQKLSDAGFTQTNAGDYRANEPAGTTIYYNNAELAPTAALIGETLGITNQVELASATESISVILRTDFQE